MPKTISLQERPYRVIRIDEQLRAAIKEARDARGTTNARLIEAAINANLQDVITALEAIGFEPDAPRRPARYEIYEHLQNELREASEAVNIPASQLLAVCLRRETAKSVKVTDVARKPRRKRRRKSQFGKPAPRRKTRRRKTTKSKN